MLLRGQVHALGGGALSLACLAGLLGQAPAVLAQPVILEVQLPSDAVTGLLWDRLYTDEICASSPFTLPAAPNAPVVLDRVTFPMKPSVVKNADSVELVVRADVYLKAESCLTDPACSQHDYFTWDGRTADPLPLDLTYLLDLNLDVQTDPNDPQAILCMLLVSLRDVDTEQVIPASLLPPDFRAALENVQCPRFSLASLQRNVLGGNTTLTRTGISASTNGSRLAMRFEVNGPSSGSDASWDNFFAGQLAPTSPSMEWSIFIDPRLLESRVTQQIDDQLRCRENPRLPECRFDFDGDGVFCDVDTNDPSCDETSPFRRTSGPTADWSGGGAAGGGHIHMELNGEIPGGFSETPCPNTIHIDPVEIDVDLRVEATDPGWMKSRIVIDPDPDDDDILLCALSLGSPGLELVSTVTLIVVSIIADTYDPSASQVGLDATCDDITAPTCQRYCIQIDDDEYDCADRINFREPLDVGGPTLGVLQLTQMVGLDAGAILGGPINRVIRPVPVGPLPLPPNPHIPKLPLRVSNGAITQGVQGGCSSLRWGYSGSFRVEGNGELCHPIQEYDDPPPGHANSAGIYDIQWLGTDSRGFNYLGDQYIDIAFPATFNQSAIDAFFFDPYPLEFLVRSSAGLNYYQIPAPPPIDNARRLEELSRAFIECSSRHWGLYLPQQYLNLLWLPDPPPFEIQLLIDYWEFPPDGEIHAAYMSSMTARTLVTTEPVAIGDEMPGMMLPNAPILFEGQIKIDTGSFGTSVVPFSLDYESNLIVTDIESDLDAELSMIHDLQLDLEIAPENLPPEVQIAIVRFTLTRNDIRFRTTFTQIAGPADFDENGHVNLVDWSTMEYGTNGPEVDAFDSRTDFDDDGDADLRDLAEFQVWYTGGPMQPPGETEPR